MRGKRRLLAGAAAAVLVASALFWAGPATRTPLGPELGRRTVALEAGAREAIAPEFPSRLSFEVTIPDGAYLDLASALLMEDRVPRARVEFRVELDLDGEPPRLLASRFVDLAEANLWHDARFDLSDWQGRNARIILETRSDPPREAVLWADRVQVLWADPVLVSDPRGRAFEALSGQAEAFAAELEGGAVRAGVSVEDRIQLGEFGVNLVLAGLIAVGLSRVMGTSAASLVPLLALAITLLIAVVHLSVPLSLGLMGALSILRFRTAVPRAEDLAHLAAAVAVGLALGAGERLVAFVGSAVVALGLLFLRRSRARSSGGTSVRRLELRLPGNGESFERFLELALPCEIREAALGDAETRIAASLSGGTDEVALLSTIFQAFPDARASSS